MQKSHVTVLALLVAAAPSTLSRSASALTCGTNDILAPAHGATNVPTNTLIWAHGGADRTHLVSDTGEVPVEERFLPVAMELGAAVPPPTAYVPLLRPLQDLEPDSRYSVVLDLDQDGDGKVDGTESITFETGSGPTTEPPRPARLMSNTPGASRSGEGPYTLDRWVELEFEHAGILIGDSSRELGDVASIHDVSEASGSSRAWREVAPGTPLVRWMSMDPTVSAGFGPCIVWPERPWPEVDLPRQSARFGVMDLAGNFSGWSSDIVLELPSLAAAEQMAAEAEADRQAEREAALPGSQRSSKDHNCALGVATPREHRGSIVTALGMALIAARRRFGNSRLPHPPQRSIDH